MIDASLLKPLTSEGGLRRLATNLLPVILAIVALVLTSTTGMAHAYLVSADPPIDGLVIAPPETLTLTFSEEIDMRSPGPSIRLLNQQGDAIGQDPLPVESAENGRQLIVSIPDISSGTYTVSWSVVSATDGHPLAGAYAFRVGGGLPPGLATTDESRPAIWAVATRWLTFLGASMVAGLLLFPLLVISGDTYPRRWPRARGVGMIAGASVALVATLAEPLIQWLTQNRALGVSLSGTFNALPVDWWWRPWTLIPLVMLTIGIPTVLKSRVPRAVVTTGTVLALTSLLGLVLTSHAAGRASLRDAAVAANAIHQASVALWCGGLFALVFWGIAIQNDATDARLNWPRFSLIAAGLVATALLSGVVNTNMVFSFANEIRARGVSTSIFSPLWSSRYGVILLVKLGILLVPMGLAILHRERIRQAGTLTSDTLLTLTSRLRQSVRIEFIAVAGVIAAGSTLALSAPPQQEQNVLTEVALVAPTGDVDAPGSLLAHLTIDPANTGTNAFTIQLTDWNGTPIPTDPAPRVTLDFTSLSHGTSNSGVALSQSDTDSAIYSTSGLALSLDGWWQIDALIQRPGQQNAIATFYFLLPDPNTQGFDALPVSLGDPAAESLYEQALSQMVSWHRVRWTEELGSGSSVLVIADFAMVAPDENTPAAYEINLRYSGSFAPLPDGSAPRPPTFDSRSSITIGDQGWLRSTNGDWLSEPPTNFSPMSEWGDIYSGAASFQLGTQQEIDSRIYQIVTFHIPSQPTQAEAWFAWWIDVETGDVARMAMVAQQHYMLWIYSDINGDVQIESPKP